MGNIKRRMNNLIVIENGLLTNYMLDEKLKWEVGRISIDNIPDIELHLATISRKHGYFQNMDGEWFYVDRYGKNGTVYNGRKLTPGLKGKKKAILLKGGDVLVFGGGETAIINNKTVWTVFLEYTYDEPWRIADTKEMEEQVFRDGMPENEECYPVKGTVIMKETGMAIYMGDVTYLVGDI